MVVVVGEERDRGAGGVHTVATAMDCAYTEEEAVPRRSSAGTELEVGGLMEVRCVCVGERKRKREREKREGEREREKRE